MYTVEQLAVGFNISIEQATELRAAMLLWNASVDEAFSGISYDLEAESNILDEIFNKIEAGN